MEYDGYQLYELLKNGQPTTLSHNGSTYTLCFVGQKVGSDNYLSIRDVDGQEKRFGCGWGTEQVWQALEHLSRGWDSQQVPPYRPYNEAEETESRY